MGTNSLATVVHNVPLLVKVIAFFLTAKTKVPSIVPAQRVSLQSDIK